MRADLVERRGQSGAIELAQDRVSTAGRRIEAAEIRAPASVDLREIISGAGEDADR